MGRPPEDSWFWTDSWQEGERAATEDICAGRVSTFKTDEDFQRALGEEKVSRLYRLAMRLIHAIGLHWFSVSGPLPPDMTVILWCKWCDERRVLTPGKPVCCKPWKHPADTMEACCEEAS